jgi:hypothetical protein
MLRVRFFWSLTFVAGCGILFAPGAHAANRTTSQVPLIASPAPGSRTASVTTQISLLGAAATTLHTITVRGSSSGRHAGKLERYSAVAGASFLPTQPFVAGERVTVHTGIAIAGAPTGTYSFTVARRITVPTTNTTAPPHLAVPQVTHLASSPSLDPPDVTVTTKTASTGGDFFLSPKGSVGNAGPMILDPAGNLVWFSPLNGSRAFDLNVQRLGNSRVLTWWQGQVIDGHGVGEDVITNRAYRTVDVLQGANGFQPDLHEFQLMANGTAFVTSYQALQWNLAPDGGTNPGAVWDGIVQEIDVHTGLVIYEWHSLDHVPVTLSATAPPHGAGQIFDYFHVNSIQQLENGDLLVSARNTSAVYEIAPADAGAIVWELGGRNSTFAMGPGTTFNFQHDARELNPSTITLFDDEAAPERGPQSRGLVLHIDADSRQATLTMAYEHQPPLLGVALGNVQTLGDGDVLVSWGTTPYFTQFTSSGKVVLDAKLPKGDDTYRVYRAPWSGAPTTKPSLTVSRNGNALTAAVSWNGATAVKQWRALVGLTAGQLTAGPIVTKQGFETTIRLPANDRYVELQALGAGGKVLSSSAVAASP